MSDKTSLGNRMKRYEQTFNGVLMPRTPTIIRVDGKAFHTFTRRLTPFNDPSCATGPSVRMHNVMMWTAAAMSRQMQNCVLAYTQSDEISFFLRDWDTLSTQQWFGGKVQKIVSVSASMASVYFNLFWRNEWNLDHPEDVPGSAESMPLFDSRVFQLPKEEVANYFIWRQKDAVRNSINFIARLYFSHKALNGKNTDEVQEMLFQELGINWNDIDTWKKRGSCVIRNKDVEQRAPFVCDEFIPTFTQDRDYIERLLNGDDE